jgi:hypothetical protein
LARRADVAEAGRGWCRVDPVFHIDGRLTHVRVGVGVTKRREARSMSAGPIRLVLTVPNDVPAEHRASDNGLGDGYEVELQRSGRLLATAESVPVLVEVFVPLSDSSVEIFVEFDPAGPVAGTPPDAASIAGNQTKRQGAAGGAPLGDPDRPALRRHLSAGFALGFANQWISLQTGS